jgi:hypothetical protein
MNLPRTILFFSSSFSSYSDGKNWRLFFEELRQDYGDIDAHFLFSDEANQETSKKIHDYTVAQLCVGREIQKKNNITKGEINELVNIRESALLSKLQLFEKNKRTREKYRAEQKFDESLLREIQFFRNYIFEQKIEFVCIDQVSAFVDPRVRILEAVSNFYGIPLAISAKGQLKGRTKIFDNSYRSCEETDLHYLEIIARGGLTTTESVRVRQYIRKYKEYMEDGEVEYHVWGKRQPIKQMNVVNNVRKLINQIVGTTNSMSAKIPYDKFDTAAKPYVLFFPNKPGNHRTYSCDPFYSNYGSVIASIVLSLPYGYSLLVKDHPHTVGYGASNEMGNMISQLDNCYYIDPRINNYDISDRASIIFGSASTTIVEALLNLKHLVLFGANSYIFGTLSEAPVHRVTNLEKLPSVIRKLVMQPPNEGDILAYLFAVLSNSHGSGDWSDDDWNNVNHFLPVEERIAKSARVLSKYIQRENQKTS